MLKPKSILHKRMLKIATILFDLIFVFAFFFVLSYVLEIVLLKQSHLQLYVAATYYTSIIQKWMLRLTILSIEAFVSFLVIWLVILFITIPFKITNMENKIPTSLIKNQKLESKRK
jgi:hypothetical protein